MSKLNFSRGALIDPTKGARESVNTAIGTIGDLSNKLLEERVADKKLKQDREKALMTDAINREKLAQNQSQHVDEMRLELMQERRDRQEADRKQARHEYFTGSASTENLTDLGAFLVERELGGREGAIKYVDKALQERAAQNNRTTVLDHQPDWGDDKEMQEWDTAIPNARRDAIGQSIDENINGRGDVFRGAAGVVGRDTYKSALGADFIATGFWDDSEQANTDAKQVAANIGQDYKEREDQRQKAEQEYLDRFGKLYDLMSRHNSDSGKPVSGEDAFKASILGNLGTHVYGMDWDSANELYEGFNDSERSWFVFTTDHQERAREIHSSIVNNEHLNTQIKEAGLGADALRAVAGSVLMSSRTPKGNLNVTEKDALKLAEAQLEQGIRAKKEQESKGSTLFTRDDIQNITQDYRVALAPGKRPGAATEQGAIRSYINNYLGLNPQTPQPTSKGILNPNSSSADDTVSQSEETLSPTNDELSSRDSSKKPSTSKTVLPRIGNEEQPNTAPKQPNTDSTPDAPPTSVLDAIADEVANLDITNRQQAIAAIAENNSVSSDTAAIIFNDPRVPEYIENSRFSSALDRAVNSGDEEKVEHLLRFGASDAEKLKTTYIDTLTGTLDSSMSLAKYLVGSHTDGLRRSIISPIARQWDQLTTTERERLYNNPRQNLLTPAEQAEIDQRHIKQWEQYRRNNPSSLRSFEEFKAARDKNIPLHLLGN